ncbi:MAG: hypothetical protein LW636_06480 [Planctomycetaceae bacterium]|nr:hypothetical protein [Planctomycetaceae bacterium]
MSLTLLTGVTVPCVTARIAAAQTLALDGVPSGPELPDANGASELAAELEREAAEFERLSSLRVQEAKAVAGARHKVRAMSAYLLRTGAKKPWSESAAVVFGARLAAAMNRIDEVIDAAGSGLRADDRTPLSTAEAAAARAALEKLAATSIDPLRAASASSADLSPERIAAALAGLLAPLAEIASIAEADLPASAWPVVEDARAARLARTDALIDLAALRARVGALGDTTMQAALSKAIDATAKRVAAGEPAAAAGVPLLAEAVEAAGLLVGRIAAEPPQPVDTATLALASRRLLEQLAATFLSTDAGADGRTVREDREWLATTIVRCRAAEAMLAARKDLEGGELPRKDLALGATVLYRDDVPPGSTPKSAARAARRIVEACAAWTLLADGERTDGPRELKDVVRALDRDARLATRLVPSALARLAADPMLVGDPDVASAIGRLEEIRSNRADMMALQSMVDSISGMRPSAGRGFSAAARRLARAMLEPSRRSDAKAAFDSLSSQFARNIPLAYEDALRSQTDRAIELTGGMPKELLECATAARLAWADSLGRGDFGGEAAQQMDRIARLCAALADLDHMGAPVTRSEGDRLALWGGWASRRATLAPASQDLTVRAKLAVASLLSRQDPDARAAFQRDLGILEQSIPLVRLAARLERRVSPLMTGPSDTLGAFLSPIVSVPPSDAYLVREWPRLLALDRALLESEFARRTSNGALRESLGRYLSALALDIETASFGNAPTVAPLKGFDADSDATRSDPSGSRSGSRTPSAPREGTREPAKR